MTSGALLMVLVVCIWQADCFAVKREIEIAEENQQCYAIVAAATYSKYYSGSEEIEKFIKGVFVKCTEEVGKEEECSKKKKDEFEEKFGIGHLEQINEIIQEIAELEIQFKGHCCGVEEIDKVKECYSKVKDEIICEFNQDCIDYIEGIVKALENCGEPFALPPMARRFLGLKNPLSHLRAMMKRLKNIKK